MPIDFSHVELFHKQLLYGALLGITMVVWFAYVLARRDSEDWKKENTSSLKTTLSAILSILLLLVSIIFFIMFIVHWINSDDTVSSHMAYELSRASDYTKENWLFAHYGGIVLQMVLGFTFAALGLYTMLFHPSPRSRWIKTRKCIAYYLVFSYYMSFVLLSVERLYIMSFLPENPGYKLGMFAAYGIFALAIWLLLRHYKNEKYIPYKRVSRDIVEAIHPNEVQGFGSTMSQTGRVEKKPIIFTQVENKKRMLAYYLVYEIILFIITFVLIIIEIVEQYEQIGITMAIFFVLSALPIGIYWILRLLNESNEENNIGC